MKANTVKQENVTTTDYTFDQGDQLRVYETMQADGTTLYSFSVASSDGQLRSFLTSNRPHKPLHYDLFGSLIQAFAHIADRDSKEETSVQKTDSHSDAYARAMKLID